MARLSSMVIDKKSGRKRRKSVAAVRAGKKGARKRGHKKISAATKAKISRAVKKTSRTHRTKSGRRAIVKRAAGGSRKAAKGRGKVGRPVGYKCSAATRAKMSKSHLARHRRAKRSRR